MFRFRMIRTPCRYRILAVTYCLLVVVVASDEEYPSHNPGPRPRSNVVPSDELPVLFRVTQSDRFLSLHLSENVGPSNNESGVGYLTIAQIVLYAGEPHDQDQDSSVSSSSDVKYALEGAGADLIPRDVFLIDDRTGHVYLTRPLDREQSDLWTLQVDIYDAHTGEQYVNGLILSVHVIDVNDNAPVFMGVPYYFLLSSDTKTGTLLGRLRASDADEYGNVNSQLHFTLTYEEEGSSADPPFVCDTETGHIFLSGDLRDAAAAARGDDDNTTSSPPSDPVVSAGDERQRVYTIKATVYDMAGDTGSALSDSTNIRIHVVPPDYGSHRNHDHDTAAAAGAAARHTARPHHYCKQPQYVRILHENAPLGAEVGHAMTAGCRHLTAPCSYSLIDGIGRHRFTVHTAPITGDTEEEGDYQQEAVIYLNQALNYEEQRVYNMTLATFDTRSQTRSPIATCYYVVYVDDVNEPPIFGHDVYYTQLVENTEVGRKVYTMNATDPEGGVIRYSISAVLEMPEVEANMSYLAQWEHSEVYLERHLLAIDPYTGVITVNGQIDREADYIRYNEDRFSVVVTATDTTTTYPGLPSHMKSHTTAKLVVHVIDVNDNPPRLTDEDVDFPHIICEFTQIGRIITVLRAEDDDLDHEYYRHGPPFKFQIEPGQLRADTHFRLHRKTDTTALLTTTRGAYSLGRNYSLNIIIADVQGRWSKRNTNTVVLTVCKCDKIGVCNDSLIAESEALMLHKEYIFVIVFLAACGIIVTVLLFIRLITLWCKRYKQTQKLWQGLYKTHLTSDMLVRPTTDNGQLSYEIYEPLTDSSPSATSNEAAGGDVLLLPAEPEETDETSTRAAAGRDYIKLSPSRSGHSETTTTVNVTPNKYADLMEDNPQEGCSKDYS